MYNIFLCKSLIPYCGATIPSWSWFSLILIYIMYATTQVSAILTDWFLRRRFLQIYSIYSYVIVSLCIWHHSKQKYLKTYYIYSILIKEIVKNMHTILISTKWPKCVLQLPNFQFLKHHINKCHTYKGWKIDITKTLHGTLKYTRDEINNIKSSI